MQHLLLKAGARVRVDPLNKQERELIVSQLKPRLVDMANDGFAIRTDGGTFMYVNPRLCGMLGYAEEEMIGRDVRDFLDEMSRVRYEQESERRRNNESSFYELTWKRKHDGFVTTITSATPIEFGGFKGAFAVFTDITARTQNEEALRATKQQLDNLMDNLPGMAYRCLLDDKWTMKMVSAGCLDLTGYASSDLVDNARVSYNDLIVPADRKRVYEDVVNAVRENRPFTIVYQIKTRSQGVRWVWERGMSVKQDDEVVGLEGFIIDYTDQKRLEDHALPQLINENLSKLRAFYELCLVQGKRSFIYGACACGAGLLVMSVAVLSMVWGVMQPTPGTISVAAGALTQVLAGGFLYLYRDSMSQTDDRFRQLKEMQAKMLAIQLCEDLPQNRRTVLKERVVEHLLGNRTLADHPSPQLLRSARQRRQPSASATSHCGESVTTPEFERPTEA